MRKIEYDDTLKTLYKSVRKEPFFVDVPEMSYITYIGTGHPSGEVFQDACNTLYTLSYILKFEVIRKNKDADYRVNPIEVSWYLDKSGTTTQYEWRAMIMQPDIVDADDFMHAMRFAKERGKEINFEKARFEKIHYGRSVQCFHQGDYNQMNNTMFKMQDFAKENGLSYDLYTHDIYLNDSRKTKNGKPQNDHENRRACIMNRSFSLSIKGLPKGSRIVESKYKSSQN